MYLMHILFCLMPDDFTHQGIWVLSLNRLIFYFLGNLSPVMLEQLGARILVRARAGTQKVGKWKGPEMTMDDSA